MLDHDERRGRALMAKFVALLTFGPDRDLRLAVRPRHREYLTSLLAQGKLVASGPFADDQGALVIYEAGSREEAQALLDADPYTEAGVIAGVELREWVQVLPPQA